MPKGKIQNQRIEDYGVVESRFRFFHVISCLLVVLGVSTVTPCVGAYNGGTANEIQSYANELKQFLISRGGYWNDKIDIRKRDPNDPSSPSGIFAVQDLEYDELIVHVPKNAYFNLTWDEVISPAFYKVRDEDEENEDEVDWEEMESEMPALRNNTCQLAKKLVKETRKYRESPESAEYAPYIRYLEDTQPPGQVPSEYTSEGKALLRNIQGIDSNSNFSSPTYGKSPLPPAELVDWIDTNLIEKAICPEARNDKDLYHAIALVIQRGFDLELIPTWDMVNHDVYEHVNVESSSIRSEEGLEVWTTRPIAAGEEILYSYNFCTSCYEAGALTGTAGIYRDFGFLEDYPQEWPFVDHDVYAQIRRDENGNDDEYYAIFHSNDKGEVCAPNENVIRFFQEQLSRLQEIDLTLELESLESSYERSMIQQYYHSLVIALSSIIEAMHYDDDEDVMEKDDSNVEL